MRFLILLFLSSCTALSVSGPEKLRFILMSDPHFGSSYYLSNTNEPATNFQFAATLNPAFALVLGDITSFANSNTFRSFSNNITTNWSIPTYYTSGNHDKYENDNEANPEWQWWNLMLKPGPNNPQGTNRCYSFVSGPLYFILFETYYKTNNPGISFGVAETNVALWVWSEMSNAVRRAKIPILLTHYQIAIGWPWGDSWPITEYAPSDRYDITNGIALFGCKYSFSGHAHATNDISALWPGHTNVCVPSIRSIDEGGTYSVGILTNGGFNLVKVYRNAFMIDLYICDPPTNTLWKTIELPIDIPFDTVEVTNLNVRSVHIGGSP